MGCCIGSALCCAGRACCSCLCAPCRAIGVHSKNYTKVGYAMFQLFWIVLALFLFLISDRLMNVGFISQMVGKDVEKVQREDDLSV